MRADPSAPCQDQVSPRRARARARACVCVCVLLALLKRVARCCSPPQKTTTNIFFPNHHITIYNKHYRVFLALQTENT